MPKGIPLTEEEQDRRRRQIFEAAVHLFISKGFLETSMREIAAAAGVGKSTLYDYFTTKDDILVYYFENELRLLTGEAEAINRQPVPAIEKLHQLMANYVEYLVENKHVYVKLTVEAQRLNMESQKRLQVVRHTYQDLICRIIEAGIEEGSLRKVDPFVAMRMTLAAMTPLVFTTRPSGTVQEMLTETMDLLLKGIQA